MRSCVGGACAMMSEPRSSSRRQPYPARTESAGFVTFEHEGERTRLNLVGRSDAVVGWSAAISPSPLQILIYSTRNAPILGDHHEQLGTQGQAVPLGDRQPTRTWRQRARGIIPAPPALPVLRARCPA